MSTEPGAGHGAGPPVRAERTSRRLGRWLRIGLSFGLLGFLLAQVDLGQALEAVAEARLDLLLAACAILLGSRLIAAVRWYLLLCGRHVAVTLPAVFRLMFVSNFVGYFMPGSIGVEVVRIYGLAKATADPALSATSVLVERLVALLALVLLVLAGAASRPPGLPADIDRFAWISLGLVLLGSLALMAPPTRGLAFAMLPGGRLARIRRAMQRVFAALDIYRSQPWLIVVSFAIALIFQLMRCASVAVAATAFGHPLPFAFILVVVPIVLLISLLPISIAGLGVREAGFVYFLGLGGMPAAVALPLSLVQRLFTILVTLPGAWWYMRRGLHG